MAEMSWDAICRRAGGRRWYNNWRQTLAMLRRRDVLEYWRVSKGRHGWQAQAAVALGVHRSTITRDVEALLAPLNRDEPCPMCGHPSRRWQRKNGDDGV